MSISHNVNGAILYAGPSLLTHEPIVAIAVGLKRRSKNDKTGNMLQTYIMRQDIEPHIAAGNGFDDAICGDCPLRAIASVSGIATRPSRCYVNVGQAPLGIYRCYRSGGYLDDIDPAECGRDRDVRLGSYGDPCAVPLTVWIRLLTYSTGWTGYTHQWRQGRFWRFRRYLMASCETHTDHCLARGKGWRTFQTGSEAGDNQLMCPAYTHGINCAQCGLCNGSTGRRDTRRNPVIPPHGGFAVMSAWKQETL